MIPTDLESKRKRTALRYFTYGVMTISTIIISALCLLFALGYRFDNETLTVEQGGLLQFASAPSGAQVEIDGVLQGFRTNGKATVGAGSHDIVMKRDGYRDWSKTVTVEAGGIHWLNYTRFIPSNLTTSTVREFDTMAASLTSPNRRYIALQPVATEPRLIVANIRDEQNVTYTESTLPAASFTQPDGQPQTFEIIEWNLDGRYLLLKHVVGEVTEFIRFDRENPNDAINLSAKFGPISKAQFAGNNGNVIFANIGGSLKEIAVEDAEPGTELATGVKTFSVYRGDTLAVTAERANQQEISIIKDERETVVAEYAPAAVVKVALTHYFNRDYLAISHDNIVDVLQDPASANTAVEKKFVSFEVDQPSTEWLYFSNNGRFIVAQNQGSFTTYDLERRERHERTFSSTAPVTRQFRWLDDYYLIVDLDNNLRIVEFDGANERALTSVVTGQTVSLNDNAEILYSVGMNSANNKFVLQRSQLVIQ